jgi:hypothetical protein
MLDRLFVAPAIKTIDEALGSARVEPGARLAVVGNAKLAGALRKRGDVVPVGLSARAAKKLPHALTDLRTIEDATLAAVVGVDVTSVDDWQPTLREWARVTRDGGAIVLVDHGVRHSAEASRRALCAGLTELEQRRVGRLVITSGLVTHI